MKNQEDIKLCLELIPETCHYQNARSILTPAQWNQVRRKVYHRANYECEICGLTGKQQGYKNDLECHEVWRYNDKNHTQKLVELMCLCPLCHQVKHFGRANKMGKQVQLFKQLELINEWTHKEVANHVGHEMIKCAQRSQYKWKLDISLLTKQPYEIDLDKKTKKRPKR